jgi:hypothetical protein
VPPGIAPATPIIDAFNRSDSASLGPNWSSPCYSGEASLRIQGSAAYEATGGVSSSYWNTLIDARGGVEVYADQVNAVGTDNSQIVFGLTAVGYGYRFVCDKPGDAFRVVRTQGGSDTTIATNNGGTSNSQKLWAYMEPSGSTGMQIWCFKWDYTTGLWVQEINVTDTAFGVIGMQYIGLRASTLSSFDNFGGGSYGVTGQGAPGRATVISMLATGTKSFGGQGSPGILTAASPGASPKVAPLSSPATTTAGALPAKSKMATTTAFGTMSSAAVCATGSTSVPAYPPIEPPTPPPPPPPPDPRDVPALDGPFTYIMYNAMLPLAWADEDLGWPMLNFFKAIAYIVHEPYALAVDPGWQLVVDIDNVPSKFLDWLAQFVGIPTLTFRNLPNDVKRAQIVDAPGWHRGTRDRMVKAAQSTLTGNKNVFVYERYDPNFPGQDRAYHITFITYQSETPSSAALVSALTAAKPGGLQMTVLSRAGQIWMWFRDHYPPTTQRTWANAKSDYTDWEHARDVTYY